MKSPFFLKAVLAFVVFPFMAYEGIDRGLTYGSIDEGQPQVMEVLSVINANGRPILPDYQAKGRLISSGAEISVNIFKREYEQLSSGDKIRVFATPSKSEAYITASKLEESKPFIHFGPFTFTWHLPVAVFGWLFLGYFIIQQLSNARTSTAT